MTNKKNLSIMLYLLLLCLTTTSCKKKESIISPDSTSNSAVSSLPILKEPLSSSSFLLNTVVTITLYDYGNEELLQDCFELCRNYEELFSRTKADSEIGKLNSSLEFPFSVSEETAKLLSSAIYYSELSYGAFDLTIAPLSSLWDFTAMEPSVPSESAIQEAIRYIDYKKITLNNNQVSFQKAEMAVDLGAIAKGYIADRLKDFLLENGVHSAIINLGGNVLCVGEKPDGSPFKIGIQKPFEDRNETIAIIEIKDKSVVSSGIYERFFKQDNVLYHHILNPKTGYPYENNLIAVTIISEQSVDGDGLSTACFSLGLEKGMELINSLENIYAVFITKDYTLHYSEGFKENIVLDE